MSDVTSNIEDMIEYVEKAATDRWHEDLCNCSEYPATCVTYGDIRHPTFDAESVIKDLIESGLMVTKIDSDARVESVRAQARATLANYSNNHFCGNSWG